MNSTRIFQFSIGVVIVAGLVAAGLGSAVSFNQWNVLGHTWIFAVESPSLGGFRCIKVAKIPPGRITPAHRSNCHAVQLPQNAIMENPSQYGCSLIDAENVKCPNGTLDDFSKID